MTTTCIIIAIVVFAIALFLILWNSPAKSNYEAGNRLTSSTPPPLGLPIIPIGSIGTSVTASTPNVVYQLPVADAGIVGQSITINFAVPGNFAVQAQLGVINVQDLNISSTSSYPYIFYSSTPMLVQPKGSAIYNIGYVQDVLSVTFTLRQSGNAFVWVGQSTPQPISADRVSVTSSTTINVPPTAQHVHIEAWGAGGAGGMMQQQQNMTTTVSGSGGGSGGAFVYDAPISASVVKSISFSIGTGGKNPEDKGGDTKVQLGPLQMIATGGMNGTPSPSNGTEGSGGVGGGVTATYNGHAVYFPPPATLTTFPGVAGGNTSGLSNAFPTVCGLSGSFNVTAVGIPGMYGCLNLGSSKIVASAPGGGAGGYAGAGGSANTFTYSSLEGFSFRDNGGGVAAQSHSGAGGAGQGPDITLYQPGISGADGGAILLFT